MTAEAPARARRAKPGSRILADRYARALLEVAIDKKLDLDRLLADVEFADRLLEREKALEGALAAPTIPAAKRLEILEAVLVKTKITPESMNVLRLLVKNDRVSLVPILSESFRRRLLEHRQIQPGEVVSAHPLSSDQKARLAGQLGRALGKTMELTYRIDPALLGGVVVRVGNRIFDASVTTQLRQFKEGATSRL
jgi:F-type H+-transporting ATPase subunit delta